MKTIKATLCFLLRNNTILLGYKKRSFGVGKWNGVGGKVDATESPLAASIRETKEEIGVNVAGYLGDWWNRVLVQNIKNPEKVAVFVYMANKWEGEPVETEEILPEWFEFEKIPYDLMWPDDRLWLPRFIKGEKIYDSYVFGKDVQIIDYKMTL